MTREELLQIKLSDWMESVEQLNKQGILALEQYRVQLEALSVEDDIRYKYFRKEYVKKIMMLESESESYEKLVMRFHDFTVGTLEYYLQIFNDDAFEGEMEMLPKEARAAVCLNNMFSREEADWDGKLSDLKECAKHYPALGKNIKRLANLIGKQMEEQEQRAAESANQELMQMVYIMKDKIRQMAQQGQTEAALSVLAQVKALAPNDRELVRIEEEITGALGEKQILLSISILCSGRSETTRACLESLEEIRRQIPCELIVVDTGCDEVTRNLLANYADVITCFEWCNDFAKARNEGLKLARGEWFLYLDDDEWFSDVAEITEFFVSGAYKKYGAANYIQRNYLDRKGTQYTDSWVTRMVRLDADTRFVSRIHEYLSPISGETAALHSVVEHYGYVYETEEALWAHYERNSVLLKQMIEEEPEELRWYMLLAQEYRTVCKWKELYELGESAIRMLEARRGTVVDGCGESNHMVSDGERIAQGAFYGAQIWACKEAGKLWQNHGQEADAQNSGEVWACDSMQCQQGFALCEKALADARNTELTKAFCELHMSWFTYWLGEYEEAISHGQKYLGWKRYFADKESLLIEQRIAPFVADAFDVVMEKQTYSIMICADLWLGRTQMLAQYLDELGWNQKQIYVFEDMIPTLAQVMDAIADTETGKKLVEVMKGHGALWEYYKKQSD